MSTKWPVFTAEQESEIRRIVREEVATALNNGTRAQSEMRDTLDRILAEQLALIECLRGPPGVRQ